MTAQPVAAAPPLAAIFAARSIACAADRSTWHSSRQSVCQRPRAVDAGVTLWVPIIRLCWSRGLVQRLATMLLDDRSLCA